jgi:DNA-binding MarR family transcriptional regulator
LSSSDDFPLEGHVGFLLRKAHQRHVAIFAEATAETGLTPTQFAALRKLAEVGSATQNHLGRLLALDPATIQGVVRRLTERGLISRTQDPTDRRMAVLTTTEAGRTVLDRSRLCARRAHEAALAPLSVDERVVFLSLLRRVG